MPPPQPTSIYEQYRRAYEHHATIYGANTAILMLVGGFYELYDVIDPATGEPRTSMKRAVETLGIQLKLKEGDAGGKDGLFAGFPRDSLMKYVPLLTRENWTVAVYDQVDAVGKQRKDRELARIYSPGMTEPGIDAVYLGGVWLKESPDLSGPPAFAAAVVDLTTGAVTTYEGAGTGRADSWATDDLVHFFQVHPPKEIVLWWAGAPVSMPGDMAIRRALGSSAALLHRRPAPAATTPLAREDLLRRAFQAKTVLPLRSLLGWTETSLTESVMVALLRFIEDHCPSSVEHLRRPIAWTPATAVFLGNHALTQLNMITPRPEDSVLGMFQRTHTAFGKRAMRERLLYPLADPAALELRYQQVEWILQRSVEVETRLKQIHDLPRLHQRIRQACPSAADFLLLDQSYQCAASLMEDLEGSPLAATGAATASFRSYLAELATVVSVEKARRASEDLFCLQDSVAPATAALEKAIAAVHAEMAAAVEEVVEACGLTPGSLRLEFKESSVCITGTKAVMTIAARAVSKVQGATIRSLKSSSSMELPKLTALYRKLMGLRAQLLGAIAKELPPLCDSLAAHADAWGFVESWVATLDVTNTIAKVSLQRGFCRPRLSAAEGAALKATGLAHPLIENQQTRLQYVRHTVELGPKESGWLVYGMNASGKSSLMKAVGIAVLLAQAGCYVPASSFTFTPFRALFTRILNKDDLWAGLSSFAVEMTELNEILRRADAWSLVLGDEVCSGTESDSATALVGAALDWMSGRGARYIFATHLHGLHSLPCVSGISTLRVWHLRVRYDAATDRLIYERTLQPGAGSSLYGLEVAKAMGLPLSFLETAHSIRRQLTGTVSAEEAATSRWNGAVARVACEVCGAAASRDLEVHHVQQRRDATAAGRNADGSGMNSPRNLAVLCEACHDRHHAGEITVGPVVLTSDGPVRETASTVSSRQPTGLNDEQLRRVEYYIRTYATCPPRRILFDLEQKEGIRISFQRFCSIRRSLSYSEDAAVAAAVAAAMAEGGSAT
jgi:DNA mismatch repair protein MutS